MRRALLFTAVLSVPLAAAAKPQTQMSSKEVVYMTITLENQAGSGQGQQLEVQSWHWGALPRQGGSNQLRLEDSPGASGAPAGRVTGVATDPADPNARGHSMLGASDRVVVGGSQTEPAQTKHDVPPPRDSSLGSESERTFVVAHVLERGTLTVKANLPGCTIGKRYAGAQFASGRMRYELKEVVISNCAPGVVELRYAKVTVRGWDPEKKEQ